VWTKRRSDSSPTGGSSSQGPAKRSRREKKVEDKQRKVRGGRGEDGGESFFSLSD